MARPLRIHIPGMLYHVFSRGTERTAMFKGAADCRRFLRRLEETLPRFDAECVAYCLMGNHDHLLIRVNAEPISSLMQQLNSQYCQQFNRCYGRVGPLVQGRFGSRIVGDGEYARSVIRYLALNPVVAECCARPDDWLWSSYRFAIGLADPPPCLALDRVWDAFGTLDPVAGRERLIHFVTAGVEDVFPNPLLHGSDALRARVAPLLDPLAFHREYLRRHRFATRPTLGALLEGRHTRRDLQDAACAAFGHAYTLAEIGAAVGRAPSTIWRWIQDAKRRQAKGPHARPLKSSAEDIRGKIKT